MSYVVETLLPEERIIHTGKVHWFVYAPAVFWFVMTGWIGNALGGSGSFLGGLFTIFFIYYLIKAIVVRRTTEVAVTSKRVIAKFGALSRRTVELNHSKIESFNVHQGIFGRLFNFGTLTINGTGGMHAPVPVIADPIEFRRQAAHAVDASQSNGTMTSQAA